MDFAHVQNFLLGQYSGRLVLYVDDIAKVLGKSDKAISELISRDSLPFKVKMVGGLRCVDIFQVAQWLCSDPEIAQQSVAAPAVPKLAKPRSKPVKPTSLTAVCEPSSKREEPALTGKVAAILLKMRRRQGPGMERFVHRLRNTDEVAFMSEVTDKLFYTVDLLSSSYVVTLKSYSPTGFKILANETRKYFENYDAACIFLLRQLLKLRDTKSTQSLHLLMEKSSDTLFHAIASKNQLTLVRDSVGFDLPGS